jgi:pimeloyl-ACP methyl ester carboxylesterase
MKSRLIERIATIRRPQIVGTVLAALVIGCAPDKPIGPPLEANRPPSFMIVCDPAKASCNDGTVNPSDSYLVADIVATTSATYFAPQPFEDPQTGQTVSSLTVNAAPVHMHVEAGYDVNRQPVIHTKFTDGADPQSDPVPQITSMSTTTNTTTERNTYGTAVYDQPTPDLQYPSPMNLLGDMTNANVTAGAILNINTTVSQVRLAPAQLQSVEAAVKKMNPSGRFVVDQPSAGLLRIKQTMTAAANASSRANAAADPPMGNGNANGHGGTMSHSKTYELRGNHWLLKEMRTVSDDSTNGRSQHLEHVMAFHISSWSVNAVRDAERQAKRPTAEVVPIADASGTSVSNERFIRTARRSVVCLPGTTGPNCTPAGGGGGGGTTTPDVGANLGCATNVVGAVHADGANLILQHGILSDATTWCGIEPVLRSKFRVGFEIRHSLNSHAHIDDQANDLRSRVNLESNGRGQFIVVGHSNGGLVARRYAEQGGTTSSGTGLIRGVVTISTPHKGAPVARVVLAAAQGLFSGLTSYGCTYVYHGICAVMTTPYAGLINTVLAELALNASIPSILDIQPNSGFLSTMNATPETFLRAGVQNYSWNKWTFFRILGDTFGTDGGGRRYVKTVDTWYHRSLDCAVVGGLAGFFWQPAWQVGAGCAMVAAGLKGVDDVWKQITVPGSEQGDAVVPGHSQLYPNVASTFQFGVYDADSHTGVLKQSSTSVNRIATAITITFTLPPIQ